MDRHRAARVELPVAQTITNCDNVCRQKHDVDTMKFEYVHDFEILFNDTKAGSSSYGRIDW